MHKLQLDDIVQKKLLMIESQKEKFLEAWVAETGIHPSDAVLCVQNDGTITRFWIEPKVKLKKSY